ncbi:Uncharacterised protein (plasmid) [Tsukamurella tyrosinosolvens]|uniref:Uncharacterized protein n=1 Tax=Tsukamurella tyrosinosolvens TaxID=57704 RepID=A0A1H4W7V7_TSUTY|nr:DUF5360 family protein [Tsukamurella tyrosinosolvens]AUN40824.1 hypothetical protein ASU32_13090 [Tsukamurella tyrosinosolvens]KXO99311.1 hypothetical protein AXK58_23545 [Tsukamurella tyrosinosolvens]QRY83585.1 DUF5360 family protein [Tsukamurella tyrosinosolvens]SEC89469.1 hypothetical protein SAMN04489793_3469 [Tsukamurella tyrosinosolvens]VEH89013.1 Uncharacterised protein [Tsukamurella tyrosinosolvens]
MRGAKATLLAIDLALAAYWAAIIAGALPEQWRFRDYSNPVVQTWNWSFLPLDVLAVGLSAGGLQLMRTRPSTGRIVLTAGCALTFCAGLMAISFWALAGDVDLLWWVPNVALMAVPAIVVIGLARTPADVSERAQPARP